MYKYPATTKDEMISAIEEISKLTGGVHMDRSAVNQQVGKLRSLASHFVSSAKPELDLEVAIILKDCGIVGDFDHRDPHEEQLIEEWVHKIFIKNNEDENLEIPWRL